MSTRPIGMLELKVMIINKGSIADKGWSSYGKGEKQNMISRIWHGWITPGNAEKYEAMLKEEIFVGIQSRHIRGFEGIQLLRREVGEEVEFVTIMVFDSLEAVREFAGKDYELAVVPKKARAVLSHFDERSQHYEIRAERKGEG